MVSDSASLILLGIRSGIRLAEQVRGAYVDSTKGRELVLPLPNYVRLDVGDAAEYFTEGAGAAYVERSGRLAELVEKIEAGGGVSGLSATEGAELQLFHKEIFGLALAERDGSVAIMGSVSIDAEEFNALVMIRQWRRGTDPNPSVLQRLAGTFIEIGIDYLLNAPGVIDRSSARGKALAGFLEAMDDVDFAEGALADLPKRLFIATLDTVAATSALISGDEKVQELVRVTASRLSQDVAERFKEIDGGGAGNEQKKGRVGDWAELVFRSVLSSAGSLVVSDPARFLGIEDKGQSALVGGVGSAVLGMVLDDEGLRLDRVFSRDGLETVIRAALTVAADHPELLGDVKNEGLRKLLGQVARELAGLPGLMEKGVLPELVRVVIEKTGENLELLWPDLKKPQSNLALAAARRTLEILSRKPPAGSGWLAPFGRRELLEVVGAVLDELVANPQWLVKQAKSLNPILAKGLEAVLDVLRRRADERLTPAVAAEIVKAAVRAVALRVEFLAASAGQPLVALAIDLLLGVLFDEQRTAAQAWQLLRAGVISALAEAALRALAQSKLRAAEIEVFREVLTAEIEALDGGRALDVRAFESKLRERLLAA